MKALLIFDLDGTIIDSAPDFHTTLQTMLQKYNLPDIDYSETKRFIGSGFKGFVEKFDPKANEDKVKELYLEFLELHKNHFLDQTYIYPGALEMLSKTHHQIALCTNKPRYFAEKNLEELGLADLPWVAKVYGDTFSKAKPDPQGVHHIISSTHTKKENVIFIGDGLPDALVSKYAGLKFFGVSFGYHPKESLYEHGATKVFDSYSELDLELHPT